jgi:tetratricopeptide (TPR) repeat protein
MKKDKAKKQEHKKQSAKKTSPLAWWLPLLGILPVTFLLFYPCIQNGFTNWDDPTYITDNPLIKEFTGTNIKKIFTGIYFSNYQPLHIFSYAIEYHFFRDHAAGYHAVSILLHVINTALVSWMVWLITGNRFITAFAGLLFGIHPLHVESIAWAAERKDLLYSLFFFLSVIFYLKYIQSKEKIRYFYFTFLFFILSIFSKTMAASLPPVLCLFDFYYGRKLNARLIIEKIPFFVVAIIMGLISVAASKESGSITGTAVSPLTDRIFFACDNLMMYFVKLILPVNLSAYYPYPERTGGTLPLVYYISPVFSIGLLLLCFYSLRFTRILFLCIAFFVLCIFLVLQLLPVGPAIFSERYSYVPSAGFFLLLGLGINRLAEKKQVKPIILTVAGVWCLWLCTVTWQRNKVWKDSITLWNDVISQFDKALHAYNNRADAYYKAGNYEGAISDLNKAISLNSNYAMAWYNRGNAYGQLGKFREAWQDLDKAIQLDPENAGAINKRGQANAVLGNKDAAFNDFNRALALDPSNPEIYYNIGITWINSGNKEKACKALSEAVRMNYPPALKASADICK